MCLKINLLSRGLVKLLLSRTKFTFSKFDSLNYELSEMITDVENNAKDVPVRFLVSRNYPNPFNPTTVISYHLSAVSQVTLKIYDILGREVATLVDGQQDAGVYKVAFDGGRYSSGVYFYRISAVGNNGQGFTSVKKFVLMK